MNIDNYRRKVDGRYYKTSPRRPIDKAVIHRNRSRIRQHNLKSLDSDIQDEWNSLLVY